MHLRSGISQATFERLGIGQGKIESGGDGGGGGIAT